jgi:hypothetical protein
MQGAADFPFLGSKKSFVFSPFFVDIGGYWWTLVDNGGQWWTSTIVHQIFFRALKKCPTFAP